MATKIYYENDGDLSYVKDKTIAIIGYGNQGRSQALNMRDSGIQNIIVGSVHDDSWTTANDDGFPVYSIAEASKRADIIFPVSYTHLVTFPPASQGKSAKKEKSTPSRPSFFAWTARGAQKYCINQ